MKPKILLLVITGWMFMATAHGASLEKAEIPSLISVLNDAKTLTLCGERVPTDVQDVRERLEKELLLTTWDRSQVLLWLKRSRRYLPLIEQSFKENDLPEDLKYVAIAESALRAHAGSPKGAVGYWQFIRSTGRKYGLVINRYIDERRHITRSTQAAVRYLDVLYKEFGSWTLAIAAYNMGEKGLRAEILAQGTQDYYRLYLPLETQRFIFRILAIKLIISDPARYGFVLSDRDYYPPLVFDSVEIDCPQEIPVFIVAQAAETYFKVIKDLNPHIRGHYFKRGRHQIWIPAGASSGFRFRYRQQVSMYTSDKKERVYVVRKGDNLSSIAAAFDVPLAALIIWNRLDLKRPIYPGQRLIIYPGTGYKK